jgi:hypothetical protein
MSEKDILNVFCISEEEEEELRAIEEKAERDGEGLGESWISE